MSRGERLVRYFLSRLPNLKLTVHHATLRSHDKAFITRFKSIFVAYLPIEECSIGIAANK